MSKEFGLSTVAIFVVVALFPLAGFTQTGQTDPRGKTQTLRGTVEGINSFAQSVRIKQEKIPGYSDARIGTYAIDDPAILKKLEIDDQIVARIYEKDDTLYDIRIVQINDARPVPFPPPRPQ